MNWLKRAIRKWLCIEPVTVNQTFVYSGEPDRRELVKAFAATGGHVKGFRVSK